MKPIHFEMTSYIVYVLTIILIAARYQAHRDYWYALIGCTLVLPFQWVADKYRMFLTMI